MSDQALKTTDDRNHISSDVNASDAGSAPKATVRTDRNVDDIIKNLPPLPTATADINSYSLPSRGSIGNSKLRLEEDISDMQDINLTENIPSPELNMDYNMTSNQDQNLNEPNQTFENDHTVMDEDYSLMDANHVSIHMNINHLAIDEKSSRRS